MRFHYHRAWTLMLLDRNGEALAEIEQGIRHQPDYVTAYSMRSCLRARLGQLQSALEDQERVQRLLRGGTGDETWRREGLERSHAISQAYRRAIELGETSSSTALCESIWDRWSKPRPRSPLLDD